jgi:hypothetical protein
MIEWFYANYDEGGTVFDADAWIPDEAIANNFSHPLETGFSAEELKEIIDGAAAEIGGGFWRRVGPAEEREAEEEEARQSCAPDPEDLPEVVPPCEARRPTTYDRAQLAALGLARYLFPDQPCRCQRGLFDIVAYDYRNGKRHYRLRCLACGRIGQLSVAYYLLSSEMRAGATLAKSHLDGAPPCEHCGRTGGVEEHHWAPAAVFSDSSCWPTALLCRACHREWHMRMNTPGSRRAAP